MGLHLGLTPHGDCRDCSPSQSLTGQKIVRLLRLLRPGSAISLTAYPTSRRPHGRRGSEVGGPVGGGGAAQPPPCEPSHFIEGRSNEIRPELAKTQSPALTSEGDRDRLLPGLLAVARSNIASYT